jgi:glycopeptide antibiotics resistance protein
MLLRHPILSFASFAYLAVLGWLTLTPQASTIDSNLLWRLAERLQRLPGLDWVTFLHLEFAANVALFVPFGVLGVLLLGRSRWWLAIILGLVATVAIELAQQGIAGRVSDPRDLVANGLGTIVGVLLALIMTVGDARRNRMARQAAA